MERFEEEEKNMKKPKIAFISNRIGVSYAISAVERVQRIFRKCFDKQALTPVISTIIMASVVIALSFAVLGWSQFRASDYAEDYSETVDAEIARLQERLTVEYTFYNDAGGILKIYLLNYGEIDIRIENVRVYNYSGYDEFFPISEFGFHNGTISSPDSYLPKGEAGYIKIQDIQVDPGKYFVRILTERRSSFETEFEA